MVHYFRDYDYQVVRYSDTKPIWRRMGRAFGYSAILGGVLLSMSQTATATATLDDAFKAYVGTSFSYDNNLLRLSDNKTPPPGKNTKGDFITQIRAGLIMDWEISRQHLVVKANVNQNWFETYDELNYLGHDVLGQWNWVAGSKLNGEIGYSNKTVLGSFAQINGLNNSQINGRISNTQTFEKYFVNGDYQIISGWYLRGGFTRNDLSYSAADRQISNRSEDAGEFGIRHLSPGNTMLGLRMTITDGTYPQRPFPFPKSNIDNAYTRNSYNLEWDWHYSVKTRLDGQIGYTQQEYKHLSNRNFAGITARGNLNWEITGKTAILLTGWREISAVDTVTSSFALRQGVRLTPSWLATPKVQLSMPISYEKQEYLGDTGDTGNGAGVLQHNKISNIGINLSYTPLENTEISLFILHTNSNSNIQFRSYQDQSAGMNIQVAF